MAAIFPVATSAPTRTATTMATATRMKMTTTMRRGDDEYDLAEHDDNYCMDYCCWPRVLWLRLSEVEREEYVRTETEKEYVTCMII